MSSGSKLGAEAEGVPSNLHNMCGKILQNGSIYYKCWRAKALNNLIRIKLLLLSKFNQKPITSKNKTRQSIGKRKKIQ